MSVAFLTLSPQVDFSVGPNTSLFLIVWCFQCKKQCSFAGDFSRTSPYRSPGRAHADFHQYSLFVESPRFPFQPSFFKRHAPFSTLCGFSFLIGLQNRLVTRAQRSSDFLYFTRKLLSTVGNRTTRYRGDELFFSPRSSSPSIPVLLQLTFPLCPHTFRNTTLFLNIPNSLWQALGDEFPSVSKETPSDW